MSQHLLDSFELHLSSLNRSPKTLKAYLTSLDLYYREHEDLSRSGVSQWLGKLIQQGAQPPTVRLRLAALKVFSKWLADEGEISSDILAGFKAPKLPTKATEGLTDDELARMLKACKGQGFAERRDEALLRFMVETGVRASECIDLCLGDVEPLKNGIAVVRKGKGGKARQVAFGPQTAASLDRYLRARRLHRYRHSESLWLGTRGPLTYHGLSEALKRRATRAGVANFHVHITRHSFAQRWLRNQGSEQGLMTLAGWSDRSMLDRYTSASASERAVEEAKRLNLGDM